MKKKLLKIILFFFLIPNCLFAKPDFFQEGIVLYNKNKLEDARFKFEQDIVYNPKRELSYLYLSKIFKNLKKIKLQEQNLNTVILLNPKNEEAIYYLARLKLDSSDYKQSKELNDRLIDLCSKFCGESKKLKKEIENLSKK